MLNLSHEVCFFSHLIICQPSCFFTVEESPLRLFFNHVDLNGNDELDVYELQHFFHDIEPENPVADPIQLVRTMKYVMKQLEKKEENSYTISWQQFRENYAGLDTLTEKGAPQVSLLHLTLVEYSPLLLLSKSTYLCLLMAPGPL
jgi:hypothetical protein